MPYLPLHILLFLLLAALLVAIIQVGLLTLAFDKLGLSPSGGFLLLLASIFGSLINLPLTRIPSRARELDTPPDLFRGLMRPPPRRHTGSTLIAINVGGGLIPVVFSFYLMITQDILLADALLAVICVALISFFFSRPIPGVGVGMPILVAPIAAALVALLINVEYSAPLAYIGGTLGVLIGADLLRLHNIGELGAPVASIGGAGTFDGIFITGIVAALLA